LLHRDGKVFLPGVQPHWAVRPRRPPVREGRELRRPWARPADAPLAVFDRPARHGPRLCGRRCQRL